MLSCEHGGNEVPQDYGDRFAAHAALLASHRGWDPGALQLAEQMAAALHAPLYAATTTRLLIDLNRSIGHRQLHSEVTRGLPRTERDAIVATHYRPHRDRVEAEVASHIANGERVLHVALHSFTPVLDGVTRRADVAWLYDPRRSGESAVAQHWLQLMGRRSPELRLRRNYPYQGRGDGLTALLRRRHADADYIGIEIEVNQRYPADGGAVWDTLRAALVDTLRELLEAESAPAASEPAA